MIHILSMSEYFSSFLLYKYKNGYIFYVYFDEELFMKILVFWDIYWRIGRKALEAELDALRDTYKPDFVMANVDNLSSGRGAVEKHILELEKLGIDIFSSGDHILDNIKFIEDYMNSADSRLIRPANFYEQDYYKIPWEWYKIFEKNGKKLLCIHLMWEVFMSHNLYSPFLKVDEILKDLQEKRVEYDGCIVDFHSEATGEFYGMANFLDSRVSSVFGTHTHVQTNDEIILPWWTSIIADIGMCWPLYGVIGADYNSVRKRFLTGIQRGLIEQKLSPEYQVCWICVEIGNDGFSKHIEKFRILWSC